MGEKVITFEEYIEEIETKDYIEISGMSQEELDEAIKKADVESKKLNGWLPM